MDHRGDSATCVQADIELKTPATATVLISVGTPRKGVVYIPPACGVSVTYPCGAMRRLDHLSDLPLGRPLPKWPNNGAIVSVQETQGRLSLHPRAAVTVPLVPLFVLQLLGKIRYLFFSRYVHDSLGIVIEAFVQ